MGVNRVQEEEEKTHASGLSIRWFLLPSTWRMIGAFVERRQHRIKLPN
jgi:hypothetical protein